MDEVGVGRPERELAMGALDEHRRAERLDAEEYLRRSAVASRARVRSELDDLFVDLPEPHPRYADDAHPTPEAPAALDRSAGDEHHTDDRPPSAPDEGSGDSAVDLPELVMPLASRVARHAGLLSLLAPVIAFGLFAVTGFRFPVVFLLVPVAIGVLGWLGHRHAG